MDPGNVGIHRFIDYLTEILKWMAKGKINEEIALILKISSRTVQKHLEHILKKLGVETRMAASALFLGTPSDR